MKTTNNRRATHAQPVLAFRTGSPVLTFMTSQEAISYLGISKREFYFALTNGTELPGGWCVDHAFTDQERRLIEKAERLGRKTHLRPRPIQGGE